MDDFLKIFSLYERELRRWNESINLVQADTLGCVYERHFRDSAQLADLVPREAKSIVDIGSGAGFPGMVLAILLKKKTYLIESNRKKAIFLKHVNNLYSCPATILNEKWQDTNIGDSEVVTSRAFASLKNILAAMEYVSRETKNALGLFLKGEKIETEIQEAKETWSFAYESRQSAVHENGKIISVTELKRK